MYTYTAQLVRVIDGDTVRLKVDLGFFISIEENFRLAGIDAPELRGVEREAGLVSKDWLIRQFEEVGGKCYIVSTKTEKYGRWLAVIYLESIAVVENQVMGDSLNQRMINEGFAVESNG